MKLLLLGTCQIDPIVSGAINAGHEVDHMLVGSKRHDGVETFSIDWPKYDAFVFGLVLRHVIEEASGSENELIFWRLDEDGVEALLERCVAYISEKLDSLVDNFTGRPGILVGFIEPSRSYVGPMFRYDPVLDFKEFVHRLNIGIKRLLKGYKNVWFVDPNITMDAIGRESVQDDILSASTHASFIGDWDWSSDQKRIVAPIPPSQLFQPGDKSIRYGRHIVSEIESLIFAVNSDEKTKLVIVDLDDTLWRGVAAEDDYGNLMRREGWPLGFVESLLVFKRRGGMLAICSKNNYEETVKRLLEIWKGMITIEDFVSVKIDWTPKSDAIAEIIQEANVLAKNVLFIDDNPRELEEVKAVHPELRTLPVNHYLWRTYVLTSPDMLVPYITAESSQKTELVKAKINREKGATSQNREEWLMSLDLRQSFERITSLSHPQADRAVELLNKTNQFNTNGRRWSAQEITDFFNEGGYFISTKLADKNVDNGLIGLVLVGGNEIKQAVLSCRVFGLGAEIGMMREACAGILRDHAEVVASVTPTGKNFVCLDIYARLGFAQDGDLFRGSTVPEAPAWIHPA